MDTRSTIRWGDAGDGVVNRVLDDPARFANAVTRARELAERYGARFAPPSSLVDLAERGERYTEREAVVR